LGMQGYRCSSVGRGVVGRSRVPSLNRSIAHSLISQRCFRNATIV
jgi:hypothetical protein